MGPVVLMLLRGRELKPVPGCKFPNRQQTISSQRLPLFFVCVLFPHDVGRVIILSGFKWVLCKMKTDCFGLFWWVRQLSEQKD